MDNNTWSCDVSGWSYFGNGCGGDMAGAPCTCTGTGPGYTPVTVSCGQNACGSDGNTWFCDPSGWMFQSLGCT
jgi:hypothetical protein